MRWYFENRDKGRYDGLWTVGGAFRDKKFKFVFLRLLKLDEHFFRSDLKVGRTAPYISD
jgi:hypothetical protein